MMTKRRTTLHKWLSSFDLIGKSKISDESLTQEISSLLDADPLHHDGPRTVHQILARKNIYVQRDRVQQTMHLLQPDAAQERAPGRKRIYRSVLVSKGPNEEWSIDGHDKMTDLGMPIYGIVDKFSGKILSMEIVPNNRTPAIPAILFLRLCKIKKGNQHCYYILTAEIFLQFPFYR